MPTFPHPDNPNIECKLPLFHLDPEQNYSLVVLRLVGEWFRNESNHLPFRSQTFTVNGLFLIDQPFYVRPSFSWEYDDKFFSFFKKYSGTDAHDSLNKIIAPELKVVKEGFSFPYDMEIDETNEDIVLTLPELTKSYNVVVTALYNYDDPYAKATTISDFKSVHCGVKANTTKLLRIKKIIRDEEEGITSYLNYGSVKIAVEKLPLIETNIVRYSIEDQFEDENYFFLYENLDEFLAEMTKKIDFILEGKQFLVPDVIRFRKLWGKRISGYRSSDYSTTERDNLIENQKRQLISWVMPQGASFSVFENADQRETYYYHGFEFFDQESLNGDNSFIYCTIYGPPTYIEQIRWRYKPERYKEYALIRPYPVGDHLSSFRREDDIVSNDQNTFWILNNTPIFLQRVETPPVRYQAAKIYAFTLNPYAMEGVQLASRTYGLDSPNFVSEPEWSEVPGLPAFFDGETSPRFDIWLWTKENLVTAMKGWRQQMLLMRPYQLDVSVDGKSHMFSSKFVGWHADDTIPDQVGNYDLTWENQDNPETIESRTHFISELDYEIDEFYIQSTAFSVSPVYVEDPVPSEYLYNNGMTHEEYYNYLTT